MLDKKILERIKPGARIRVWEKIKERDKERQSAFEGIVIARKHGAEIGATFTVRAILQEVGVEKVFPINSPLIAKIDVLSSPRKVHRSKLYFIRGLSPKRVAEKLKTR